MFNKMKKFFARVALAVLALQLVTMVLPVQAAYADASSVLVSTNLNEAKLVAGAPSNFHVNISNPGTLGYIDGVTELAINGDVVSDIQSFKVRNLSTGDMDTLVPSYYNVDGADVTILQEATGISFAPGYSLTSEYEITFSSPRAYSFMVLGSGETADDQSMPFGGFSTTLTCVGKTLLTATPSVQTVPNDGMTPATVSVSLDNKYGENYAQLRTNFVLSNTNVGDITSLTYTKNGSLPMDIKDLTHLTQNGTEVDGYLEDTVVSNGDSPVIYDVFVSFKKFTTDSLLSRAITFSEVDQTTTSTVETASPVVINVDGEAPAATIIVKTPTNLKSIPVSVVFSESVTGFDQTKVNVMNGTVSNFTGSANVFDFDVTPADLTKVQDITVTIPAGAVTDLFGNPSIIAKDVAIHFDPIAPAAVTDLAATANDQGYVVLTWTNPVAGTFDGLKVLRDGAFLATLGTNTTTYTDNTAVRGQTYSYTVTAYDNAGNESAVAPVQVTVPSNHIAAAVSDSSNYSTDSVTSTATVTPTPTPTVTTASKNDDNEFPWWGIVILVILAGVGAWLIYSQKPAPEVAPVVPPVSANSKKQTSKSTVKKTNTKK